MCTVAIVEEQLDLLLAFLLSMFTGHLVLLFIDLGQPCVNSTNLLKMLHKPTLPSTMGCCLCHKKTCFSSKTISHMVAL